MLQTTNYFGTTKMMNLRKRFSNKTHQLRVNQQVNTIANTSMIKKRMTRKLDVLVLLILPLMITKVSKLTIRSIKSHKWVR